MSFPRSRNGGNWLDIQYIQVRVTQGFGIQQAGFRRYCTPEIFGIIGINKMCIDTQSSKIHIQLRITAAVQCSSRDNLVTRIGQQLVAAACHDDVDAAQVGDHRPIGVDVLEVADDDDDVHASPGQRVDLTLDRSLDIRVDRGVAGARDLVEVRGGRTDDADASTVHRLCRRGSPEPPAGIFFARRNGSVLSLRG